MKYWVFLTFKDFTYDILVFNHEDHGAVADVLMDAANGEVHTPLPVIKGTPTNGYYLYAKASRLPFPFFVARDGDLIFVDDYEDLLIEL